LRRFPVVLEMKDLRSGQSTLLSSSGS
jgi:hypothetical protein